MYFLLHVTPIAQLTLNVITILHLCDGLLGQQNKRPVNLRPEPLLRLGVVLSIDFARSLCWYGIQDVGSLLTAAQE